MTMSILRLTTPTEIDRRHSCAPVRPFAAVVGPSQIRLQIALAGEGRARWCGKRPCRGSRRLDCRAGEAAAALEGHHVRARGDDRVAVQLLEQLLQLGQPLPDGVQRRLCATRQGG